MEFLPSGGGWPHTMFELIKILLQKIDLSALGDLVARSRKRKLAAELLMIVVFGNEIVVHGQWILTFLKFILMDYRRLDKEPEKRRHNILQNLAKLRSHARNQARDLEKFMTHLQTLASELGAIDPSLFRGLNTIVWNKINFLRYVVNCIKTDKLPLLPSLEADFEELSKSPDNAMEMRENFQRFEEKQRFYEQYLFDLSDFSGSYPAFLETYLQEHNPKEVLSQFAQSLDALQKKIGEIFTIQDVLIELKKVS
jgi:hypothetical protein